MHPIHHIHHALNTKLPDESPRIHIFQTCLTLQSYQGLNEFFLLQELQNGLRPGDSRSMRKLSCSGPTLPYSPSLQLITCALIQLIWICFPATDFAQHGSKSLSVTKIQGSLRDALTLHVFAVSCRSGMQDFSSYFTCGSLRSRFRRSEHIK